MEDLVEELTRGHVTEVKIVLTSVVAALAIYQVFLMAVGYGKLKLPFLKSRPASKAHRTIGDAIVPITILVGFMCLAIFGLEEHAEEGDEARAQFHIFLSYGLLGVLAIKIAVIRWLPRFGGLLPFLGVSVLILFLLTWVTTAGAYL